MATLIDEIKNQLNIALNENKEAKDKLKEFEDGENGGKWLDELRSKMRRNELDEEDKQEKVRLEEEEKRLKKDVDDWKNQTINLQKKLADFGKEEGNEQIA